MLDRDFGLGRLQPEEAADVPALSVVRIESLRAAGAVFLTVLT